MNEFKINEFLTLRLENGSTIIYINEKKIIQCKYLLINKSIDHDGNSNLDSNDISMDDQVGTLDHSLELDDDKKEGIPPEAEFIVGKGDLIGRNLGKFIIFPNIQY